MGKKKKKSHPPEEPVSVNINAPLAYVSAMDALAYAQKFALQRQEIEQLVQIANAWVEIGNQLLTTGVELVYSDQSDTDSTVEKDDKTGAFGFTGGHHGEEEAQPSPNTTED